MVHLVVAFFDYLVLIDPDIAIARQDVDVRP
jgi:hypothetical protein